MKRHRMTFKGQQQDTIIAIRAYADDLHVYVETHETACSFEVIGALAELFVEMTREAIERQSVPLDGVRALLAEVRESIMRSVVRPPSPVDHKIVTALSTQHAAITLTELQRLTGIASSTLNARLLILLRKSRVTRRWDGKSAYWSVRRASFAAPANLVGNGALLPINRVRISHRPPRGKPPLR